MFSFTENPICSIVFLTPHLILKIGCIDNLGSVRREDIGGFKRVRVIEFDYAPAKLDFRAFAGFLLKKIRIPDSIEMICRCCFQGCFKLEIVTIGVDQR